MSKINPSDITYDGTFLIYKGVHIKVSREFIQDAGHSVPYGEVEDYIIREYNKKLPIIREIKLNQILDGCKEK